MASQFGQCTNCIPVNLKRDSGAIAADYELVFSVHCKQLFPPCLVRGVRCINLHPGLNPHNRGWYPQVFSIINGLPAGATLHEIDEQLDHGPIIDQEEVPIRAWDTSLTTYLRIQAAEVNLLRKNLLAVVSGTYTTRLPSSIGNVNLKADFRKLCQLDLSARMTMGDAINRLRALTHGDYANAYFEVPDGKVYVQISLEHVATPGPVDMPSPVLPIAK